MEKQKEISANEMDAIGFVKIMHKLCTVTPDMYKNDDCGLKSTVERMDHKQLLQYAALGLNAFSIFKHEFDNPEMKVKIALSDIAYEMSEQQSSSSSEDGGETYVPSTHRSDVMYG